MQTSESILKFFIALTFFSASSVGQQVFDFAFTDGKTCAMESYFPDPISASMEGPWAGRQGARCIPAFEGDIASAYIVPTDLYILVRDNPNEDWDHARFPINILWWYRTPALRRAVTKEFSLPEEVWFSEETTVVNRAERGIVVRRRLANKEGRVILSTMKRKPFPFGDKAREIKVEQWIINTLKAKQESMDSPARQDTSSR